MKNGTGNSSRLLVAAILTFGGLAAIAIGIAMAIAPANDPACGAGTPCISGPAVAPGAPGATAAPVAARLRHSDTD